MLILRIEPSSAVPIYRQLMEQIKFQIAAGILKEGDQVPSVRELATKLAVNHNTIVRVYNELCREKVLIVERGEGTFVSANNMTSVEERKKMLGQILRDAVITAEQLHISIRDIKAMLEAEYDRVKGGQAAGKEG